jgi:hypothetical protein
VPVAPIIAVPGASVGSQTLARHPGVVNSG